MNRQQYYNELQTLQNKVRGVNLKDIDDDKIDEYYDAYRRIYELNNILFN